MTITSATAVWNFVFSGATGDFAIPARVLSIADLTAYAISVADGTIYFPTYTIELAADFSGATVHVTAGGVASDTFHVRRVATGLQPTPFLDGGRFPASAVERQFDRICTYILAQQLDFERAVRADPSDLPIDPLPPAAQRLGKLLGFDPVTGGPALIAGTSDTLVSAAMAVVVGSATLALARAAFGMADVTGPVIMGLASGSGPAQGLTAQAILNLLAAQAAGGASAIAGWTYANGTDAVNDINIAAGSGVDSSGAIWMKGAALTKQLDAVWAAGNNAGGRLSGALADGDYNIWAIGKTSDFSVDYGFETTANATPTLPTGYGHYRRVGWFKRAGGTIVAFHTYELEGGGLEFKWDAPTLDVDLANTLTTTRRTDAIKGPLTFSVRAILCVFVADASAGHATIICCPDQTDVAPSISVARLTNITSNVANDYNAMEITVRTSAAGLVAARSTLATVDALRYSTVGFIMSRR